MNTKTPKIELKHQITRENDKIIDERYIIINKEENYTLRLTKEEAEELKKLLAKAI